MGLNVYVDLVVGVPLLELGSFHEEKETINLVDTLGNETGKSMDIIKVYFNAWNGSGCLIGSNKDDIARGELFPEIEYFCHQLLDVDDIGDSNWFHQSDHGAGIDQVIIGLSPESTKGPVDGRYESFSITSAKNVNQELLEVNEFLEEKFGYTGEVYVISLVHYSY